MLNSFVKDKPTKSMVPSVDVGRRRRKTKETIKGIKARQVMQKDPNWSNYRIPYIL